MKKLIELMKQGSEIRTELNTEANKEIPDAPKLLELRNKLDSAETEFRAACDASLSETREVDPSSPLDAISSRVELRNYFHAYSRGTSVEGAEAELNAELKMNGDTQIPLHALIPRQTENRADVSVGATAIAENQADILARVFSKTRAQFMGVRMPAVPTGDSVYPIITTGAAGAVIEDAATQAAEAATFVGSVIRPYRLTARYSMRVEDMARLSGMENVLREDLRSALGVLLDNLVINGNAADPTILGLLGHFAAPTAPSDKVSWTTFMADVYGGVDGKYASSEESVRILTGIETYSALGATIATNTANSALLSARATGASVSTSSLIPDPASTIQSALRTVDGGAAVAPVWEGIEIIRDPYTNAADGKVNMTAIMLAGFDMLRTDGWTRLAYKV